MGRIMEARASERPAEPADRAIGRMTLAMNALPISPKNIFSGTTEEMYSGDDLSTRAAARDAADLAYRRMCRAKEILKETEMAAMIGRARPGILAILAERPARKIPTIPPSRRDFLFPVPINGETHVF